jgi:hypothetical protein
MVVAVFVNDDDGIFKFITHRTYPWRETNRAGVSVLFFEVTRRTA